MDVGDKDARLVATVNHLEAAFGEGFLAVEDHWEGDLRAVGLISPTRPGFLAYLAIGNDGNYFVSVEGLSVHGSDLPYEQLAEFTRPDLEGVSQALKELFTSHERVG